VNRPAFLLATLLLPAPLFGQSTPTAPQEISVAVRAAVAARPTTPLSLDGQLDEPEWQSAEAISDFVQRIPFDGQPASERTEVRVQADESAIYVGVWLWDSDPARIVDGESIRDASLDESDAVLLIFDTFRDRRNGFVFGTNPSGI
jgi:hypothetical protein